MMGFGGFVNGGSYPSPSSSNLSASAPPFTLDRSPKPGSIPLVDLIEPSSYPGPANWISSRPSNSEINPPSNAFEYGGSETSTVVVSAPAEPYYAPPPPPFGSSVVAARDRGESSFVIADLAGYDWSSFSRAPMGLEGSSSCDDYRQRISDSKWSGDGLWNGFADWKQSHDVAVPSMYENYMNPDGEILEGLGRVGESSNNADFLEMGKFDRSFTAENSDEKPFSGKNPSFVTEDYSRSVLGSLSGLSEAQLRPPSLVFGPKSSTSHEGYAQDFLYSQNEPVFSSGNHRIHPEKDDPNFNEASQDATTGKSGRGLFNSGRDIFSLDLNINEAMISAAQETVDHYNHGVDSPCWKGVHANHSSQFEASEAGSEVGKTENSLNRQSKQAFLEKSDENTVSDSEAKTVRRSEDIYKYERGSHVENAGIATRSLREGEAVNDIVEEALQYCSARLHVPVEDKISSSIEKASCIDLKASTSGPSVPKIDVPGLVDTIHNLSNFLMHHCTRGSSRLKERDLGVVQRAIYNLGMCMSKNGEEIDSSQEPFFSVNNAVGSPGGLQKAEETLFYQTVVNSRSGDKGNDSAKVNEVADLLSKGNGHECNKVDEDKVTQAFKKVLTENFNEDEEKESHPESLLYKNLWLEAEAALCSLNYKARYNRMKIEMEGPKLLKSKDEHENSADRETKNSQQVETISPKDEVRSAPNIRGLSESSPISHEEDVMARLRILKCRVENSNPETPAAENSETPSSSPKIKASFQGLSDSGSKRDINDFDASVMARFHIIKSRAENLQSSPPEKEEMKLPRFASQSTYWPILGSIPEIGSSGPDPNNDRFTPNEFRSYDPNPERVSNSDWEHVGKEDLSWQHRH